MGKKNFDNFISSQLTFIYIQNEASYLLVFGFVLQYFVLGTQTFQNV